MGYIFNGATKIISLTSGTIELDVRDMYSRWKDWVKDNNSNYLPIFQVVGGDSIDIAKGIYVTSYFFLINGWRVRPQEANHKLNVVNGVLLTLEGADPFLSTLGNYNVLLLYSQPIRSETISTSGSTGPTSDEIASAVWDKLLALHQIEGSAGKALSTASSGGVDYEALATGVWNISLTNFNNETSAGLLLKETKPALETLLDLQVGNWEIQGTEMIFYKRDGIELFRYALLDQDGLPSDTEIYKRLKL